MKIALAWTFACCMYVLGPSHAQMATSPSNAPSPVDTADLLEAAHGLLASLPPEARTDGLAELAAIAARTRHLNANQWLQEVERLVENDSDLCRRARYQARIIGVLNTLNATAALQRLAEAENTCSEPLANAAPQVFLAAMKGCDGRCFDDILAAAEHLGRLGSYPFSAMVLVSQQISSEDASGARLFFTTLSHYKKASSLSWRSHGSFLFLVERQRDLLSRELVAEAVSAAITRLSDQANDAGLRYVSVLESGATRQHTDRDGVLQRLYALAESIDGSLAQKVISKWPDLARLSPAVAAKSTAGVSVGESRPLPRAAELALQVDTLKPRLVAISQDELGSFPKSGTRVALLSVRASQLLSRDPAAASSSLHSAVRALDELEDRMERVLAAPYLVEAAVNCKDWKIASRAAELQFDDALALLRELRREKTTPLAQTPVYYPLKQTVMALRDRDLATSSIARVRDDELKARLLLALAESLFREAR